MIESPNKTEEEKKENKTNVTSKSNNEYNPNANLKPASDNGIGKQVENPNTGSGSSKINVQDLGDVVGDSTLQGIIGNTQAVRARQHLLDPNKYRTEYKTPNPGKPPMNREPYPVDLKIEELEQHYPSVKINRITTCTCSESVAAALIKAADHAEKRIIKLENMMATQLRYLMRLGSRVNINCVYYGGQTPFEKYLGIRCLKDDRIGDGQCVQIDQCLSCTRYEPIYGQTYELMNDLGASVAQILDDNQMAYMNMDDYVKLTRIEQFQKEKEKAEFDLSKIEIKGDDASNFEKKWGKGIKMNWRYVPKEMQKTHVNWRQSISNDGNSGTAMLPSSPVSEINGKLNLTVNTTSMNSNVSNSGQQIINVIDSANKNKR